MKVLLATDGSQNADAAAQLIASLTKSGQELDLIYVSAIQIPDLQFAHGHTKFRAAYVREQTGKFEAAQSRARQILDSNCSTTQTVIREGHPGQVILEAAKEFEVDLIVIGAVGDSMLDYVLFGSTSNFVATHADRSVLVVRPPKAPSSRPPKFLISFDGSVASKVGIDDLVQSGWASNSEVDLLTVAHVPGTFAELENHQEILAATKESMQREMQPLQKELESVCQSINASVVEADHVGREILRSAESQSSDVIVMGSTGRGLVARFLLGSASRYVLQHSARSVWIARDSKAAEDRS